MSRNDARPVGQRPQKPQKKLVPVWNVAADGYEDWLVRAGNPAHAVSVAAAIWPVKVREDYINQIIKVEKVGYLPE